MPWWVLIAVVVGIICAALDRYTWVSYGWWPVAVTVLSVLLVRMWSKREQSDETD